MMDEVKEEMPICMPYSVALDQLNDLRYALNNVSNELYEASPIGGYLTMDEKTFKTFVGSVIDAKEDVEELRKTLGYLIGSVNSMKREEPVTIHEGKYGR